MKKLLVLLLALFAIAPAFASVSSVTEVTVSPEVMPMDYDSMVSRPYYPNILYPNLSQDVMLKAAYATERQAVVAAYSEAVAEKLDATIARMIAKSKTVAKTKEGQAMYLGEFISKIQMIQGNYYNSGKDILHVLNYIGYGLSVETMNLLYGNMNENVDELIEWIEGGK